MALTDAGMDDSRIFSAIEKERNRQNEGIELIPSENYVSKAVLSAMGSILTNKYSEGYPGRRYYGGQEFVDEIEQIAIDRAKRLFGVVHANVQPYSGSPANFAVYCAVCGKEDYVLGQSLPDGGHLTHGWKASMTSRIFKCIQYHVDDKGFIDIDEVRGLAEKYRPKLIWIGSTAYVKEFPFEEFSKIADETGAYLAADISHIAGLVVGGVHKNPKDFVHIITTTTHKTLRGPRGGMILVTKKGTEKDPELPSKIDRSIFPGLQGGPHDHTTAAIGVALYEAMKPEFKGYATQIVVNAKALAKEMINKGLKLVGGGTENHMILLDLTPFGKGKGVFVQEAMDIAGLTANKNTVPKDPSSPFYPSGIRLGTPAVTTRGMKEEEMVLIAGWIRKIVDVVKDFSLPETKEERKEYIKDFRRKIAENETLKEINKEVKELCSKFPVY